MRAVVLSFDGEPPEGLRGPSGQLFLAGSARFGEKSCSSWHLVLVLARFFAILV